MNLPFHSPHPPRASILIGLLWCVAILSMVVVTLLHSAHLDLHVVKNYGDQVQAHYLAIAGIEKTKALLYHDAAERRRSRVNHNGNLYNSDADFKDVPLGRGLFRIVRQARTGSDLIHGILDEESLLNVNNASAEELAKLDGLTAETAAAIIDYRDEDNEVTQGGGESDQYAELTPPYLPHNAPLRTLRELLMVLGVSREDFLGEDANLNGLLDPEEDDGRTLAPEDNADGQLDAGWSSWVTIASEVPNANAAGDTRINIQEADESELAEIPGLSKEIAQAIVRHRGQNRFESLSDLLQVSASAGNNRPTPPPPPPPPSPRGNSPNNRTPQQTPDARTPGNASGQTLIDGDLLAEIADDLTVESDQNLPGRLNINTAEPEVLVCLPGVTEELAHAIVAHRQSSGYFANVAWLLKVPGITTDVFKQLEPRVCTRSHTFRILSEGRVTSSGARKRLQAIVRVSDYYVRTISMREDDL